MINKKGVQKYALTYALAFLFLIIFSVYFVLGDHTVTITTGATNLSIKEDLQNVFNFTIDSGNRNNITQINITLPANCTFTTGSNNTNLTTNDTSVATTIGNIFTNTSGSGVLNSTLSWSNFTGGVMNGSHIAKFWFNATCTHPGRYDVTITTLNASGVNRTHFRLEVNDTTAPVVVAGDTITTNASGNYTAINVSQPSIFVNVSLTELNPLNITFILRNSTGVVNRTTFSMSNTYTNTTINWTGLNYGSSSILYEYNITVADTQNNTHNIAYNVTIKDDIGPHVTFVNPVGTPYRNHTGTIVLNATITDRFNNVQLVLFNISNGTSRTVSLLTASNISATNWNVTLPSGNGSFPDGIYNITVIVNDTISNVNNTGVGRLFGPYSVVIDNSGPSVTLSSLSATTSSLGVTITATETVSSINGACTVDRAGATITGSATTTSSTQNITESGLDCGHSYSYIATCTNYAGKGGSSAATSFSTSDCGTSGGGGSSGGGTAATTWTSTYSVTPQQLSSGYTKTLLAKARVNFTVGNESHYLGVKALNALNATIEVASSNPTTFVLAVGQEKKVDVNKDNYYDVYVKYTKLVGRTAELYMKTISEAIPIPQISPPTGEDTAPIPEPTGAEGGKPNLTWLWILIAVVVIVIVVWVIYAAKKRR